MIIETYNSWELIRGAECSNREITRCRFNRGTISCCEGEYRVSFDKCIRLLKFTHFLSFALIVHVGSKQHDPVCRHQFNLCSKRDPCTLQHPCYSSRCCLFHSNSPADIFLTQPLPFLVCNLLRPFLSNIDNLVCRRPHLYYNSP